MGVVLTASHIKLNVLCEQAQMSEDEVLAE